MTDPTVSPEVKAAAEKLKVPLLEAMMDKTPASLRRLGAAAAGVALPFANSVLASKFGVTPIGDGMLMATQAFLAAYITQSVVNEVHDRSSAAALEKAKTIESTVLDLNKGPGAPS